MKTFNQTSFNKSAILVARCILLWTVFMLLLYATGPLTSFFPKNGVRLVYGILGLLSALLATWLLLKYEKSNFREIGLIWEKKTILRFCIGLLIGSVFMILLLLALLAFTDLRIEWNTKQVPASALIGYFAILPLALMEEIAFRAYPFVRLPDRIGLRFTQFIVAVAFAFYHVVGGQGMMASFLGPGVWALVFGLAAVWSRGIAMPFGIHVALNSLQLLSGMRGDEASLFALDYNHGTVQQVDQVERAGVILQLVILIIGVLATEYFIRKTRSGTFTKTGPN